MTNRPEIPILSPFFDVLLDGLSQSAPSDNIVPVGHGFLVAITVSIHSIGGEGEGGLHRVIDIFGFRGSCPDCQMSWT